MFKNTIIFLFITALSPLCLAETCQINPAMLGAKYTIKKESLSSKQTHTSTFTLWRKNNYVAHENTNTGITDVWDKGATGRLKPTRYFDHYSRGIEYQPEDVNQGKGDNNWKIKFQLVDNHLFSKVEEIQKPASDTSTGCLSEQHFTSQPASHSQGTNVQLTWLPNIHLVKLYQEETPTTRITWTLEQLIEDKTVINNAFSSREAYATTDFIDIGDNESDPFLQKMINLGFIEHTETGFYDAAGNSLSGDHSTGHGNHHGHNH